MFTVRYEVIISFISKRKQIVSHVVASKRSRNPLVQFTGIHKKSTLSSFAALRMRSEGNAPKSGKPTVGFSFTTMLQHTSWIWSRIS